MPWTGKCLTRCWAHISSFIFALLSLTINPVVTLVFCLCSHVAPSHLRTFAHAVYAFLGMLTPTHLSLKCLFLRETQMGPQLHYVLPIFPPTALTQF